MSTVLQIAVNEEDSQFNVPHERTVAGAHVSTALSSYYVPRTVGVAYAGNVITLRFFYLDGPFNENEPTRRHTDGELDIESGKNSDRVYRLHVRFSGTAKEAAGATFDFVLKKLTELAQAERDRAWLRQHYEVLVRILKFYREPLTRLDD